MIIIMNTYKIKVVKEEPIKLVSYAAHIRYITHTVCLWALEGAPHSWPHGSSKGCAVKISYCSRPVPLVDTTALEQEVRMQNQWRAYSLMKGCVPATWYWYTEMNLKGQWESCGDLSRIWGSCITFLLHCFHVSKFRMKSVQGVPDAMGSPPWSLLWACVLTGGDIPGLGGPKISQTHW